MEQKEQTVDAIIRLGEVLFNEGNDDALSNLKELYRQYGSWQETKEKDISKIV